MKKLTKKQNKIITELQHGASLYYDEYDHKYYIDYWCRTDEKSKKEIIQRRTWDALMNHRILKSATVYYELRDWYKNE